MGTIRLGFTEPDGLCGCSRRVLANLSGERRTFGHIADEFEPHGDWVLTRQRAATRGRTPHAIDPLAHFAGHERSPQTTWHRVLQEHCILHVGNHPSLEIVHCAQPYPNGVVGVVNGCHHIAGGTAVIEVQYLLPRPSVGGGPPVRTVLAETATVAETPTVNDVGRRQLAFGRLGWWRGRGERRNDDGNNAIGEQTSQLGGTHGEVDLLRPLDS